MGQTGRVLFDLETIGDGLPVGRVLPDLHAALSATGVCVLQAPPGTGKTTLVPPAVANLVSQRVVVTQPRRVATRAAARRLAGLSGTRMGQQVGYVVRGDQQVSSHTRVEFCTAGVLLRRLLADPELPDIEAVVLDEVHERALDTDLAFAMLAELRQLRSDLQLVVMSATLDADRWAHLLGDAPVVRAEAELHPLTVRWAPISGARTDAHGVTPAFLRHLADQAEATFTSLAGSVLVFAPGARECDRVARMLVERGLPAEALHGSLDPREQDHVLRDSGADRIIVATSIAESSLTVPGVRAVVDSGLAREPRYDATRGMTGLVTVSEARSSAEQRAGRAARLGPGTVVRCFPEADWTRLRPFTAAEITTSDLTQTALDLAAWGAPGGVGLALPDAPPAPALADAAATLQRLGALDDEGRATDLGRRLATLPVEPRLGRALLDCAPLVGSRGAAEVVAMLAGDQRAPGGDLVALWADLRRGVGRAATHAWTREAERLVRLVPPFERPTGMTDAQIVAAVVARAFPDRVGRRRDPGPAGRAQPAGGDTDSLLAGGTAVGLPRDSRLHGHEWLAVADMARVGERAVVRSAAAITPEAAREAARTLLVEETVATFERGRVSARKVVRLGAIELTSTPKPPTPAVGRDAVRQALAREGLRAVVGWGDEVEALRRRLALVHHHLGDAWPAVDDPALVERADEWLGPELERLARGEVASRLDLVAALRRLLPWPEASRLDELVPERLEVPTGSRIRLQYPDDPTERVVLPVKLQECFGMLDTPRLVDGRVPVLMHLLSPAQRPLAVTDDLASFWVNAYPAVRAENRGRYSKHPWPEDPLTAPPRRGTTRSGR